MATLAQTILAALSSKHRPLSATPSITSHMVRQPGLTRADMGNQAFEAAMEERRVWIRENCRSNHLIEPIRDHQGVLVGRRYRFEDPDEAVWFRMRF